MPYIDPLQPAGKHRSASPGNNRECVRCKRARWVLTFITLAMMTVILYLHQFSG